MEREDIRNRIAVLLTDILDRNSVTLSDDAVATDVAGWDSMNHLKLRVAIEGDFGITFELMEMTTPRNVRELVDMVRSKLA